MNQIILIGNVGQDPKTITTKTGKEMMAFSLATQKKYKDETITLWHQVIVFNNEYADIVKKGNRLLIHGSIDYKEYADKDGNQKKATNIIAESIAKIPSYKKEEPKKQTEEIPF